MLFSFFPPEGLKAKYLSTKAGREYAGHVKSFLGEQRGVSCDAFGSCAQEGQTEPWAGSTPQGGQSRLSCPISHALREIPLVGRGAGCPEPFLLTGREGRASSPCHPFSWMPAQQRMSSSSPSPYWFTKGLFLRGIFWLRGVCACNVPAFIFWSNCSVTMAFLGGKKIL